MLFNQGYTLFKSKKVHGYQQEMNFKDAIETVRIKTTCCLVLPKTVRFLYQYMHCV